MSAEGPASQGPERTPPQPPPGAPEPPCVLVVDDEPFVCETLADVLGEAGYRVETAGNGPAALARLDDLGERVDCVLLDVRLAPPTETEQLDGIDLLRFLKGRRPQAGVIIMTAYASVDNAVAALNLGAEAYLQKPVNPEELLALVRATVERRQLARKAAYLEAQARQQNEFLREKNRELAEANRQLQEALRRLQETQAQLIQSEKLASLGQLVAGVAHELNNPISFLYSNMGRLLEYAQDIRRVFACYREMLEGCRQGRHPSPEELEELARLESATDIDFLLEDLQALARESREGAERVQAVVTDLRNFSRLDEGEVQNVDLNQGIQSTLTLLRPELKHRVGLELDLEPLPLIRANAAQLNQVLMNLLMNAAQAIQDEGTVRILTRATPEGVRLSVSDTGCGIPPEHLSRIFDPFFTTRKGSRGWDRGSGLGLSIVHSIVRRHSGTIQVESTLGEGTTFTIELPLSGYQPQMDPAAATDSEQPPPEQHCDQEEPTP